MKTPPAPAARARRALLGAALLLVLAPLAPLAAQSAKPHLSQQPDVDAVLLELAARFDPAFAGQRDDHAHPDEPCLSPLLMRLRDVAPALSAEQRGQVAALDPHVASTLHAALGTQEASTSLPDQPELTETQVGKQVVVHYTLTGQHAAPDLPFVKILTKTLDGAIKKFAKDFKRPFFERDRDDKDVLHVYILDTSTVDGFDDAVLGYVNPTEDVEGEGNEKAQTVYMVIDKDLKTKAENKPGSWQKLLKATAYHEYFHCIQLAYNAYMSSWGLEGQAMWAEQRWAKVSDDIYGFLEREDSLVKSPELPIWNDDIRKYSTAPLWAFFDQHLGKDALRMFWEESPASQDPITIMENILIVEKFELFEEFWLLFAGRLVAKDIIGLKPKKLPGLKRQETITDLGWEHAGEVTKTAILAYDIKAPTDKKTSLFFARLDKTGGGSPSGVVIHDKNKRLELFTGFWNDVTKFKKPKTSTFVVTDGDYEFPDKDKTPFKAHAFAPYLKIHAVDFGGPVVAGQMATVTFTYTLLCVPPGPTFGVAIYRKLKGKKYLNETQINYSWEVGSNLEAEVQFQVPAFPKLKSLSVQMNVKTPTDAYGGEHAVVKKKGKIKVVPPGP